MIEIGSIIEAVVTRIEPYGVYLQHDGETVLVLIPEVAWQPVRDLRDKCQIGERLPVYVLRYNYVDRAVVGSFRRAHPEANPYRQLSRLAPGTVLPGRVKYLSKDGLTLEMPNGARGFMPSRYAAGKSAQPESVVNVVIGSIDVDEGRLWLEPAPE
jgi:ribosomal protein S1